MFQDRRQSVNPLTIQQTTSHSPETPDALLRPMSSHRWDSAISTVCYAHSEWVLCSQVLKKAPTKLRQVSMSVLFLLPKVPFPHEPGLCSRITFSERTSYLSTVTSLTLSCASPYLAVASFITCSLSMPEIWVPRAQKYHHFINGCA